MLLTDIDSPRHRDVVQEILREKQLSRSGNSILLDTANVEEVPMVKLRLCFTAIRLCYRQAVNYSLIINLKSG